MLRSCLEDTGGTKGRFNNDEIHGEDKMQTWMCKSREGGKINEQELQSDRRKGQVGKVDLEGWGGGDRDGVAIRLSNWHKAYCCKKPSGGVMGNSINTFLCVCVNWIRNMSYKAAVHPGHQHSTQTNSTWLEPVVNSKCLVDAWSLLLKRTICWAQ